MINNFIGELMKHPCGLELSLQSCDNGCSYCFANIKVKNRQVNIQSLIKQINSIKEKDSLIGEYARLNIPISFSNNSDPFSNSNFNITKSILPYFYQNGLRAFYQTKGCENLDNILPLIKNKECFYITITNSDTTILKSYEKNAPSYEIRLDNIKSILSAGHNVIVAINPIIKDTLTEIQFDKIISDCYKIGVNDFISSPLYLTERKKNMCDNIFFDIDFEKNRSYNQKLIEKYYNSNINIFTIGMPIPSLAFKRAFSCYETVLPTNFDVINYSYEKRIKTITFSEYYKIITQNETIKNLFEKVNNKSTLEYVYMKNHNLWFKHRYDKLFTIKDVLKLFWNSKQIKDIKSYLCFKDINEVDEEGNIILECLDVFMPQVEPIILKK